MNRTAVHVVSLVARWGARLAGIFMIGVFLLLVVGESISNGPPPSWVWVSPFMLGMLAAMVGMVIGWWREGLGGTIVVVAGGALQVYSLLVSHRGLGGAFPFFLVPGMLLLVSYYSRRVLSRSDRQVDPDSCSQTKLP